MKPRMHLFSVFLVLFAGLGPITASASHDVAFTPEQVQSLGIRVAPPVPVSTAAGPAFAARVVVPPDREQVVAAPLDGLLEAVNVAPGEAVQKGQILARMRSPGLVSLQREYLQAYAQARLAGEQLARDEALFNDGIIAERRLLETRSRSTEANASLTALRETLRLSGMEAKDIETLRKSGHISASLGIPSPQAGVIMELMAGIGERLEAAAPLMRVASVDTLWLDVRLPVEQLDRVSVGSKVETAEATEPARGQVILIGSRVDAGDETVLVRAEVQSGTETLRPGQFAQVRVLGLAGVESFRLPSVAVIRRGDQFFVFRRSAVGFEAVTVNRVSDEGETVVVQGGLSADDEVAVSGVATIKGAWMGIGGE